MRKKNKQYCILAIFVFLNFGFLNMASAESTTVTNTGIRFPDGTTQTTAASGGGSSLWSQSGSNIYYNGGNVGVGTSTPQAKLHVFIPEQEGALRIQAGNPYWGSARIELWSDPIGAQNEWRPGYIAAGDTGGNGTFHGRLDFYTNGSGSENKTGSVLGMSIANGSVGIGTTIPSYKLHVNGNAAGTSWINLSSEDFKEDIRTLDEMDHPMMLAKVMDMNPTTYKYKKEYGGDGTTKLGFIAEDMPEEVLSKDGKGVDLYQLLTLAIGAMKAQQQKITELEARISELQQAQSK